MSKFILQFCIGSETSRNSVLGLRPKVFSNDRATLIGAASDELGRQGGSFEDFAGVEFIEGEDGNFTPVRELSDDELWRLTVEKFNDDGRLFEAFDDTDDGRAQFVEAAEGYDLRDEAEALVESFA